MSSVIGGVPQVGHKQPDPTGESPMAMKTSYTHHRFDPVRVCEWRKSGRLPKARIELTRRNAVACVRWSTDPADSLQY